MRIPIKIILVVAMLFASAASLRQTAAQQSATPARQAYALKLASLPNGSALPMITIKFANGKAYAFIVDTGAPSCLLDRNVAPTINAVIQTAQDKGSKYDYVLCAANIGPNVLPLPQVPFDMTDMTAYKMAYSNVAGFVGTNLLDNFALKFDLLGHQLDIIYPGNIAATEYEPKGAVKVPLVYDGEHYSVDAALDGKPVRFILDTGADRTFTEDRTLTASLRPDANLTGFRFAVYSDKGGASMALPASLLRLHKMTLGETEWQMPIIQNMNRTREGQPINALGVDFLRRYRALIDLPAKIMYLSPQPDFHEDAEEFTQTGLGISFDGAQAVVAQVLSPSPAQEAGLHVGDKVMTINGSVPLSGSAEELNSVISKPKSKRVTLTVRHLGETQVVEVTLKVRKLL